MYSLVLSTTNLFINSMLSKLNRTPSAIIGALSSQTLSLYVSFFFCQVTSKTMFYDFFGLYSPHDATSIFFFR